MKKYLPLIVACCLIVLFVAYAAKEEKAPNGFQINNWSSGIGTTSKNSLDETRFSYKLTVSSETEDLRTVTDVYPILGEKITGRVISNEPPQMIFYEDYIEISGEIILDTKGLNKEQIMALEPYIVSVRIKTEQTVELTHHVDFAS